MLKIEFTTRMKRDYKRMEKRGKDMKKLGTVLKLLASCSPLPPKYQDHALKGDRKGLRECHIEPDWLLIYAIFEDEIVLSATATGSHADLLGI